jgi:hypothetical protein
MRGYREEGLPKKEKFLQEWVCKGSLRVTTVYLEEGLR